MSSYGITSLCLLLSPLIIGFIVMKLAGGGGKGTVEVQVVNAEQVVAFQERIAKAYLNARDFGIKAVTGIVQACAITTVLVVGLFDRNGISFSNKDIVWTIGVSLVLLVEGMLCGVLTTGLTYFGHYFEAHATVYDYGMGSNEGQKKLWRDRSNGCYAFALLFGIVSGMAFLEGVILLVRFWFKITAASIF